MKSPTHAGRVALCLSVLFTSVMAPTAVFAQYAPQLTAEYGWTYAGYTKAMQQLDTASDMNLRIPVLMGVEVGNLTDTWGDARSQGRTHEGIDIMAPRGTPVVSPTHAIVMNIGNGALGGNFVYTLNAGGDRYYFAHLDSYAPGIVPGKVLEPGDLIGYVGNTGDASSGPTHLHFGIYNGPATNPYPRLTRAFTDAERVAALNKIIAQSPTPDAEASTLVSKYSSFLGDASSKGLTVSPLLSQNGQSPVVPAAVPVAIPISTTPAAIVSPSSSAITRNLAVGAKGEDVRTLQKFLNSHGAVIATSGTGSPGNETAYFGPATKAALISYQSSKGITPLSGFFGPLTRSFVAKDSSTIVAVK